MNKAMLRGALRVLFASIAILCVTGLCIEGLCASVPPAQAGEPLPVHGIAIHGEPRYAANFSHFDYANPSAPQGGVFRNAATGTFDTLNPFIVRGRAALGLGYVT